MRFNEVPASDFVHHMLTTGKKKCSKTEGNCIYLEGLYQWGKK